MCAPIHLMICPSDPCCVLGSAVGQAGGVVASTWTRRSTNQHGPWTRIKLNMSLLLISRRLQVQRKRRRSRNTFAVRDLPSSDPGDALTPDWQSVSSILGTTIRRSRSGAVFESSLSSQMRFKPLKHSSRSTRFFRRAIRRYVLCAVSSDATDKSAIRL